MNDISVGIVIPIVSLDYLEQCLNNLFLPNNVVVLVVNDGNKSIKEDLEKLCNKYQRVLILNLEKNSGFAVANNSGWKWLEKEFNPKYLGTLNADTKPTKGWIEFLVKTIEDNKASLASPKQKVRNKIIDFYELGKNLRTKSKQINIIKDTLTQSFSGFCFLCRSDHLREVSLFDEKYINGCEDTDLALKFRKKKFKSYVSFRSVVEHFPSSFRFRKGTKTNTGRNLNYFKKKWRSEIERNK